MRQIEFQIFYQEINKDVLQIQGFSILLMSLVLAVKNETIQIQEKWLLVSEVPKIMLIMSCNMVPKTQRKSSHWCQVLVEDPNQELRLQMGRKVLIFIYSSSHFTLGLCGVRRRATTKKEKSYRGKQREFRQPGWW